MSKLAHEARSFFKKTKNNDDFVEGFEVLTTSQAPTIPISLSIDLTDQEKNSIQ